MLYEIEITNEIKIYKPKHELSQAKRALIRLTQSCFKAKFKNMIKNIAVWYASR